jgi:glycosyltransferase involved in cell wall biosynthesis
MEDLLTIVIPCKNEEKYIPNLLHDLSKQYQINNTEIIIADANSTDNTLRKIKEFKNILNIKTIEGGNVSVGRNNGAAITKTPYILFLDADVRFFKNNAIYDSLQLLIKKNLDLVGLSPKNYGKDPRASFLFFAFGIINKIFTKFTPFAIGAFFLTRKNKFEELGGFPNKYETSEDYILSSKYDVKKFKIANHHFGQDERRFKKLGYLGMIKYMISNFLNRKNLKHFEKNNNYWN